MTAKAQAAPAEYQNKPLAFASNGILWLIVAAIGAAAFFWDGLISLGAGWARPEYSYGPLVPVITLYLSLREIHHQPIKPDHSSRLPGLALFVFAILVGLLGNISRIPDIITYGFILYVGAAILMLAGTREGFRFWPGWLHLIFMLPLPQFLYLKVSTTLQTVSSELGVLVIALFNIPVLLDGNIIDLGIYKLQVAEACSGLRYLFPLFSFGWLIAVLYKGPNWHRVVIFFSTIPVTILMNSFRIGMIGVLVNAYGIEQADGFLHAFEGWVIFLSCTVILYAEAIILSRFFSFGAERPDHVLHLDVQGVLQPLRKLPALKATRAFVISAVLITVAGLAWQLQPAATTPNVLRLPLGVFPMKLGNWEGQASLLDSNIEDVLAADDYLVASYRFGPQNVDVLMTYYRSQTEGSGIHSPEICLPGGGWEVAKWEQADIPVAFNGQTQLVPVNRAIIQKGLQRQLVYYWFEQRGKRLTNDYEAKLLSIWNTISDGRSDGGLVRLTTPIADSASIEAAERRLSTFMAHLLPDLDQYFPQ